MKVHLLDVSYVQFHIHLNKVKLLISDETKVKKLTQNSTKSREDSIVSLQTQEG